MINTVYDLTKPGELWRWLKAWPVCMVLGHERTEFPIYNQSKPAGTTIICARCQALDVEYFD